MTLRQQFLELPPKQQAEILSKHRDINVYENWHECAVEDFKSAMWDTGIRVDRVYFSGFCSQGDGACFEGVVNNWELFLKSLGYTCPALIQHANHAFCFSSIHQGRYYHHKSVSYSEDLPMPDNHNEDEFCWRFIAEPTESLHEAVLYALLNEHNSDSLEKEFKERFESEMKSLYKKLNDEHDHLTSDAAVLDALVSTDMLIEILQEEMI